MTQRSTPPLVDLPALDDDALELVRSFLVPQVTELTEDVIGHDLAPDTLEVGRGQFVPASDRVLVEVDAAYAFLGNARASLLLVIGQPDDPGTTLYDSGGAPLHGARWISMASVCGESAWASTTHRRVVVEVEPGVPVTWQLVAAITGGAEVVPVAHASRIAITPDGRRAFVTSPGAGTVTPIAVGRPGYSVDSSLTVQDVGLDPVATGGRPERLAVDDDHVVVCDRGSDPAITILSAASHELLHRIPLPEGPPADAAVVPGGGQAVVTGSEGLVARVDLGSGQLLGVRQVGGRPEGVAVTADGGSVLVADPEASVVHRLSLPDLDTLATITVAANPRVVRAAPDGLVWVVCDPPEGAGRLVGIDPAADEVVADHELPFPRPSDLAMVPVEGQSSPVVRTAWVVFEDSRYCQFLVGGRFAGQPHSFHHGSLGQDGDGPASVAVNDYGEIWVTQPDLDQVWKWPGGRFVCRADEDRPHSGVFFGEYCTLAVYGARSS